MSGCDCNECQPPVRHDYYFRTTGYRCQCECGEEFEGEGDWWRHAKEYEE